LVDMFIFLYTVFRNSSISDEHVFCVALHFTIGHFKTNYFYQKLIFEDSRIKTVFWLSFLFFSFCPIMQNTFQNGIMKATMYNSVYLRDVTNGGKL
ncbi:MAG: hypothetical protein E6511_04835, partial [Streptococcus salivarius]|nr:hypothetical protein [Streptococcus salivarius]